MVTITSGFECGNARNIVQVSERRFRLETADPSIHGKANVHRPNTLCYQMARRFGIPSAFYEINAATAGPHGAAQRAIQVFKRAVHTLLHHF